jgi:hypothetical protein
LIGLFFAKREIAKNAAFAVARMVYAIHHTAWPFFYQPGYSGKWVSKTGEIMLCVEKDDPREAPESKARR